MSPGRVARLLEPPCPLPGAARAAALASAALLLLLPTLLLVLPALPLSWAGPGVEGRQAQ